MAVDISTRYFISDDVLMRARSTARAIIHWGGSGGPVLADGVQDLADMLDLMAEGQRVTLVPVHAELTTEEAAEVLGVSEQYLIGLLDSGEIAFRQFGEKRLVKLDDLHAYKREKKRLREQVLDEMAHDAQQWGMGY